MVDKGFLAAGYEYIIIDDCWLSHERDSEGRLQPDPERFPSGIKALAQYVHSLGLKFGIYEDYGNYTCGGYPGILGHLKKDAETFAEWEVDYIKVDGCYADINDMDTGYPEFGGHLNATGRPIVYSCSWPDYQIVEGMKPNYALIAEHCNLWRNFDDIDDSWESVVSIIDYYGKDTANDFADFAGPGHWNDPDMLIIGNYGLSLDQARVQMAIWAVLAAPLIMSNDLRTIRPEFVDILTNRDVIKINQDPMGIQGRNVHSEKYIDIFVKPVMPTYKSDMSAAVAVMYRGTFGTPVKVTFTPHSLGLIHPQGYIVTEVFDKVPMGTVGTNDNFTVFVNPTGVQLLRFNINPNGVMPANTNEIPPMNYGSIHVEDTGKTGWRTEL